MNQNGENGAVSEKNISAQALLTQKPRCYGWLRRKGTLHQFGDKVDAKMKLGRAFSLSLHIPWQHRYAILARGKLYIFNDELSSKAQKVLDLTNYTRFERITEVEVTRDVPWPFQLHPREFADQQKAAKIQCFSVTSGDELEKWEDALSQELSSGGQSRSKLQHQTSNANCSDDCGNDVYTNPDDEKDGDSSGDEYVDVDREKTSGTSRPLPAVPGGHQQQQPIGRRALPPTPAESKPNTATRVRSVPLPPAEEPSPLPSRASDGVSKPLAGRRPIPVPVGVEKLPVSPKPPVPGKPTPPSNPGRRQTPQPPPPLEEEATTGSNLVEDDLVYEAGSVLDAAMWDGTADEATQYMRGSHLRDGNFLIRAAQGTSGGFTLLVICAGAPCKFRIDENLQTKKLKISSFTFDDLESLVNHFTETNLPNKTTPLTKPYKAVDNNN